MWRPKTGLSNTYKASNPWYVLPTIGIRPSIFRIKDKTEIARIGSLGFFFLCFEFWIWVENPAKMKVWKEEIRKPIDDERNRLAC